MKKVFKSKIVPKQLKLFAEAFPHETWEHFRRRSRRGYKEVKKQIYKDQHGLCAYCEISIKMAENDEDIDDFRVEHFHPKSETNTKGKNWHLCWENMLGVCHGGSQKDVPNSDWRYSSRKNDRSCDIPKGGRDLSRTILNPLHIPGKVRLFRYLEYNGKMLVDEKTCPQKFSKKANNTIRELNLNARRLRRMRQVVIDVLQNEIENGMKQGLEFEECLERLAEGLLSPDRDGAYRPFFTVIRWYLGPAAENFLAKAGYKL